MSDEAQPDSPEDLPVPDEQPELDAFCEEDPSLDDGFTGDDLELAYQRALESVQTWEPVLVSGSELAEDTPEATAEGEPAPGNVVDGSELAIEVDQQESDELIVDSESAPVLDDHSAADNFEAAVEHVIAAEVMIAEEIESTAETLVSPEPGTAAVEELSLIEPATATIPISAAPQLNRAAEREAEEARVTPAQVLEAVLFVGGPPLTAKKLSGLLRGSNDSASVEQTIDDLNQEYAAQNRPYEIRLGDGGYRIDLRAEYEKLRLRVFGGGPREVRLSQELLEMLALVAYKQPISVDEIEALGRKGPEGQLRQLLRRELIALRRSESNPKEVRYHTTSRFLSLFGLGSLDELPQPEDVDLK